MTAVDQQWPGVELDTVMRLRILAQSLPGVVMEQRTLPVPFADVWHFIADLENAIPSFDRLVRSVRIIERDATGRPTRLRASPSPFPFRVELREGFCLMRSAVFVVGMAAQPAGSDSTRFVHVEGLPVAGSRLVQALQHPIVRRFLWLHRRNVSSDLDGIERCLGGSR